MCFTVQEKESEAISTHSLTMPENRLPDGVKGMSNRPPGLRSNDQRMLLPTAQTR
jgi:hypothetical protein